MFSKFMRFMSSSKAARHKATRREAFRASLRCERLEDRRLLAFTSAVLDGNGVLTYTFDGADDTAFVRQSGAGNTFISATAGGTPITPTTGPAITPTANVTSIVVIAGAGNDTIDATGALATTPLTLIGGAGDDTLTGNGGANTIHGDVWGKITPEQLTASSHLNADYDPIYAGNGAGLSGDTHTADGTDNFGADSMWLSANNTVAGQFLQINLGDLYTVDQLKIWNYNQPQAAGNWRGIRSANIQVSTDGVTYTSVATPTLTQAPGTNAYNTPDIVSITGSPQARFVRIVANTTWGDLWYVGLSEVQVFGSPVTVSNALSATATATSMFGAGYAATFAADGSGLDLLGVNPTYHSNTFFVGQNIHWLSASQANVAGQAITYDLGSEVTLDRMHIWNYNQWEGTTRGMNNSQIEVSTDGTIYTTVFNGQFAQADGTPTYAGFALDTPDAQAKFVRITANTNWGDANYVGLSEVKFFQITLSAPIGGNDTIDGKAGADNVYGGIGNDTFNISNARDAFGDIIIGGSGTDTVKNVTGADFVLTDFRTTTALGTQTVFGVENLDAVGKTVLGANTPVDPVDNDALDFTGITFQNANALAVNLRSGNDQYIGGLTAITVNGGAGDDTMSAGVGGGTLNGEAGVDTLTGGTAATTLNGGASADILTAGAGATIFSFLIADINGTAGNPSLNQDTVNGFRQGTDKIRINTVATYGQGALAVVTGTGPTATGAASRIVTDTTTDSGNTLIYLPGTGSNAFRRIKLVGTFALTALDFDQV
jgi:hypothetical protein